MLSLYLHINQVLWSSLNTSMIKKWQMKKLLWSWIILLNIHVNGMMMEFDDMEWYTDFNGTKMFHTENDVFSEAKFPMVGLTLIQSAAAKGAGNIFFFIHFLGKIYVSCYTIFDFLAVCLDGSLPGYHLHRGFGSGANNWLVQLEVLCS